MAKNIDFDQARKTFNYDLKYGVLSLNKDRGMGGRFKKGSPVGTIHECGPRMSKKYYLRSQFDGGYVYIHRIIWVLMTGVQPNEIDHIDGDGLNNKWENLRNVPHSVNGKNQKKHKTNTSGNTGVCYRKDSGKWRARIMVDDKSINLGTFKDKQDAINARINAEKIYNFTGDSNEVDKTKRFRD